MIWIIGHISLQNIIFAAGDESNLYVWLHSKWGQNNDNLVSDTEYPTPGSLYVGTCQESLKWKKKDP